MNLYELLQVSETATGDVIQAAYRALIKDCHPDRHAGNKKKAAEARALNMARETLTDPDKRAVYDAVLARERNGNGGFDGFSSTRRGQADYGGAHPANAPGFDPFSTFNPEAYPSAYPGQGPQMTDEEAKRYMRDVMRESAVDFAVDTIMRSGPPWLKEFIRRAAEHDQRRRTGSSAPRTSGTGAWARKRRGW